MGSSGSYHGYIQLYISSAIKICPFEFINTARYCHMQPLKATRQRRCITNEGLLRQTLLSRPNEQQLAICHTTRWLLRIPSKVRYLTFGVTSFSQVMRS